MKSHKHWILLATMLFAVGCASNKQDVSQTAAQPAASEKAADSGIFGDIPAGSAFAKIQLGMTQGQIHEILGQPTDSKSYQTGKAWIPFYFGPDVMRTDEFYKGVGVITYTGAGIGGVHWKVHKAVYNPSENGFVK